MRLNKEDNTMPNWCENELRITNNTERRHFINKLNQYIIDNDGRFFQYLRPMPEYLLHASDKWYDWRVENWGCKWDACETEVVHLDEENNCITIQFNSPWSGFPLIAMCITLTNWSMSLVAIFLTYVFMIRLSIVLPH